MRNIKFTALLFITLLVFDSCKESVSVETISTAPTINIKAPASVVAGVATALDVEVKDGPVTPLKEGTITFKLGSTVVYTNKQTATANKLTLSVPSNTVKDLLPGSYKLEVVAVDVAGQELKASKDVAIACDALEICKDKTKTTVIMVAPPSTQPDVKVELIFEVTGSTVPLTKVSTNCYCAAVDFANGSSFKFRKSLNASSNPDWLYVEKDAECKEIKPRPQGNAPDKTIILSVLNWRNTAPCGN